MSIIVELRASDLYESYRKRVSQSQPLLPWTSLAPKIQKAWETISAAALDIVQENLA